MTSFISHTTVDCTNAYELSEWWKQLLGYVDLPDDPNAPGHEECLIQRPDGGHQVLFIEVPDVKQVKNRLHFDLRPAERTRDEEVAWALSIGATQVGCGIFRSRALASAGNSSSGFRDRRRGIGSVFAVTNVMSAS